MPDRKVKAIREPARHHALRGDEKAGAPRYKMARSTLPTSMVMENFRCLILTPH
ncbi:MAG: hypothetical protein ACLP05_00190 [Candidatus Kryptoniota bacterium]